MDKYLITKTETVTYSVELEEWDLESWLGRAPEADIVADVQADVMPL